MSVLTDRMTAGMFIGEVATDVADNLSRPKVENEWAQGYENAVSALCEATKDDELVARLLSKYWKVSEDSARNDVSYERNVRGTIRALISYLCEKRGFTVAEARRFAEERGAERFLSRNIEMRSVNPDRLYEVLKGE